MNYYCLLEDEKSFMKVLPKWLEYMNFKATRVVDIQAVVKDNYILQSGKGVTRLITKVLFDTIDTIISNPNKIDKLIIMVDTESETEEYRKAQIWNKIEAKYDISKFDFEILIFVCNHCFESWLLGAKGIYPSGEVDSKSDFYPYFSHYNISVNDPELMMVPENVQDTIAKYHFHYLCELFRYQRIRYTKSRPTVVMQEWYYNELKSRIEKTSHLKSFAKFVQFIYDEASRDECKYV